MWCLRCGVGREEQILRIPSLRRSNVPLGHVAETCAHAPAEYLGLPLALHLVRGVGYHKLPPWRRYSIERSANQSLDRLPQRDPFPFGLGRARGSVSRWCCSLKTLPWPADCFPSGSRPSLRLVETNIPATTPTAMIADAAPGMGSPSAASTIPPTSPVIAITNANTCPLASRRTLALTSVSSKRCRRSLTTSACRTIRSAEPSRVCS